MRVEVGDDDEVDDEDVVVDEDSEKDGGEPSDQILLPFVVLARFVLERFGGTEKVFKDEIPDIGTDE